MMKKDRRVFFLILSFLIFFAIRSVVVNYFKHDYFRHWAYLQKKMYSEKRMFDGVVEPVIPEHNDDTILGVDSNKNGIRDDVEIWINRYGESYNERMALRQYAKAFQNVLYILESKENIPNALNRLSLAENCIQFVIVPERKFRLIDVDSAIRYLYLNTKKREELFYTLDKKTFSYSMGDSDWYKQCEFKVQNFEEVFRKSEKSRSVR